MDGLLIHDPGQFSAAYGGLPGIFTRATAEEVRVTSGTTRYENREARATALGARGLERVMDAA
jgi:hypothetical protein